MLKFSNAKINLGLQILYKRPDGYHELQTVFHAVPFYDLVEIVRSESFAFSPSGLEIPGSLESNLCVQAYKLLAEDFDLPPVHIYLHKRVPMGAGLGGGSSNASAVLHLLNEEFALGMDVSLMKQYASRLGADCAFFVEEIPALASGIGDQLEPVKLDLSPYWLLLILPKIHVNTAEAYQYITISEHEKPLRELIEMPINRWKDGLQNDFEQSVFAQYPPLQRFKEILYERGAIYASMSGSGSAMYGLFEVKLIPEDLAEFARLCQTATGVSCQTISLDLAGKN